MARGAVARGKRVAFGDGVKIRHHPHAVEIYRHNPNVARPGDEGSGDLEWIHFYAGKRGYCHSFGQRWLWIPGVVRAPGEIYLSDSEMEFAERYGRDYVVIEPNVPPFKSVAVNKQWPRERYDEVCHKLTRKGVEVVQFQSPPPYGPGHVMQGARVAKTPSFRYALAVLSRAALYVGPEGGLHHGAAADKRDERGGTVRGETPAVVIFGGFISPEITGYRTQRSLYAGGEACGSLRRCEHCADYMRRLSVGDVYEAAIEKMRESREVAAA